MNRYVRFLSIPLLLLALPARGHEPQTAKGKLAPDVRRYAHIVDWAFQKSQPEQRLKLSIQRIANEAEIPREQTAKLLANTPSIIERFRIAKATEWSVVTNVGLVNRESKNLRESTMLIETSPALQESLREVLTPEQLDRWTKSAAKRNTTELRRLTTLARDAELIRAIGDARSSVSEVSSSMSMNFAIRRAGIPAFQVDISKAGIQQSLLKLIVSEKKVARITYERRLLRLDAECVLSAAQKQRLTLAIKGVVSRNFQQAEAAVADIESVELDDLEAAVTEVRKLLAANITTAETELWTKTVARTLTAKQIKLLKGYQRK